MKKKILAALMAAALAVPTCAYAEEPAEVSMELNYEAVPEDYVGTWTLTAAYTADDGILAVPEDACSLEIKDLSESTDANKLVDEAAYIHADAIGLSGIMTFDYDDIDVDEYKCSSKWENWTVVNVKGEGDCEFKGANKLKIRDDDEGVFFDVLTGVEVDDMELFDVIGLNADGQLIVGYSEDHIENDADAEWAYAYIFEKAE